MSTAQLLTRRPSPHSPHLQAGEVTLRGIEFHYEIGGPEEGPVIFMIMGLGAQMLMWIDDFCENLIYAGYRVVRFDNRDIGLSGKVKGSKQSANMLKLMARFAVGLPNHGAPYNLVDMAEDASLLIAALGLKKVHVLGASMGGMIAQILAAKHPEQVKTLNIFFSSNNKPFGMPPGPAQLHALIGSRPALDEESIVKHSIKVFKTIGSPRYHNPALLEGFSRKLYRRSFYPRGVMHHFMAILATGSLEKYDRHIVQPTLVIHGAKDKLIRPSQGKAIAQAIPHAEFKLIEDMGHDIPRELIPKLTELLIQNIQKAP